jgi:hypothetical protein
VADFADTLQPNEKWIKNPTVAQKKAIDDMRIPDWVNRDNDVKVVEVTDLATSQKEIQYRIFRDTPKFLLRKDLKKLKATATEINRVRRVAKGDTLEMESPTTKERLFFRVVKTGSLQVYHHKNRRSGKDVLVIGGTAVLAPDQDLYFGFNETKWHPKPTLPGVSP